MAVRNRHNRQITSSFLGGHEPTSNPRIRETHTDVTPEPELEVSGSSQTMAKFEFTAKKRAEANVNAAMKGKATILTFLGGGDKPEPPKTTPHRDQPNFLIVAPDECASRVSSSAEIPESVLTT